jgi:chromosome segregation ATPase
MKGISASKKKEILAEFKNSMKINEISDPATYVNQAHPMVRNMSANAETFRPSEQVQSNNSTLAQRLDGLMKQIGENEKAINGLENDIIKIETKIKEIEAQPQTADLKKLLDQLKTELATAKRELGAAKKEEVKLAKEIQASKTGIDNAEKNVRLERTTLIYDLQTLEGQISKFEELCKAQPENKKAIDTAMAQAKKQIESKMVQYEVLKAKCELEKGSLTVINTALEATEIKMKDLKKDIDKINANIRDIQKKIGEQTKSDSAGKKPADSGSIDYRTPMVKEKK